MLKSISFQDVGPAPSLTLTCKERMNFLTGDNGLGKSFLLDVAWWVLTRTWARQLVIPHQGKKTNPEIRYSYGTAEGDFSSVGQFDRQSETWSTMGKRRHLVPGMILYAQVDGGFSVWDPARNYWKKGVITDRPPAYFFTTSDVWNGLRDGDRSLCEGLIRDWGSWQRENGEPFAQLTRVLKRLSPSPDEPLVPGRLKRISLAESVDHPTLKMPYHQEVALVHASAGMRRVIALAYLLVWTWQEHLKACELLGTDPIGEVIFLIDEVEAHLHPQWQRRIVPALLDVMEALTGHHDVKIQLLTATHSPLVLASTEPSFDPERDAIWELDLKDGEVTLQEFPWFRHGDANAWLTSSVFDLREPRSIEAEKAISAALALLRIPNPTQAAVEQVDQALAAALSDIDRFWVRWSAYKKNLDTQS